MLFLFAAAAKMRDEQVGEPQLRGVRGEGTDDKREDLRRGRDGWGRTMASGVRPAEGRLAIC